MANLAENEILISGINPQDKEQILTEFEDEVDVTNDPANWWNADDNFLRLSFLSKWHEPGDFLKKIAQKYNCSISGVCWEFANDYVNSFRY